VINMNWEDMLKEDETFHKAFAKLGQLISTLENEIAPNQPQQYNPSRKIMSKIRAISKQYEELDKLRRGN